MTYRAPGSQTTTPFASDFTYGDDGRLASYLTGAVTHQFTYAAGRPQHLFTTGGAAPLDLTYAYDPAGNVSGITDPRPSASQTFATDALDRLTTANGPWGSLTWTYDAAGNRLTQTSGAGTATYAYNAATQRLTSVGGAGAETFTYDNGGQLTSDGLISQYVYSPTGHLTNATGAGVSASYTYDASGERLSSNIEGQTTYTLRGVGGETLSEYLDSCGTLVWTRDLIYAGGQLLGAAKALTTLPTVSLTAATGSTGEAAGSATATVQLTTPGGAALGCPVTVSYTTSPGTATAGADYTTTHGTLTFASGSANGATQSLSVPIVNDALNETNETFTVTLLSPEGAALGVTPATTVTILDDDPLPSISIAAASAVECDSGTTPLTFPVSLSGASGRTVSVSYATSGGTALSGHDYTATSGTLTIPAGSTSGSITVPILCDAVPESTESFAIVLSNPSQATLGTSSATATIFDNDNISITLSADHAFPVAAGTPVTWTASVSGGASPYQYQFWLSDGTEWRLAQTFSTTPTFTWSADAAGTFQVQVRVLDAGSLAPYDGSQTTSSFAITAPPAPSVTLAANTAFPVAAGTAITWTATGTGGAAPLQYEFFVYDPAIGWTIDQAWSSANTFTWTPSHPADYALQVWVRNAGSTAEYDTWAGADANVTAAAPVVTALTPNVLLPVAPGTPITWTAQAAGGSTPLEYEFWWYQQSTTVWTSTGYGPSPTWTWTPPQADTYLVQVWVRPQGSTDSYDAWRGTDYWTVASGAVSDLTLTASHVFPTGSQETIAWTAKAAGGTAPLQYKYVVLDATTGVWTLVQDWSTTNTYSWTPGREDYGLYALQVWVRSTGSQQEYDAWAGTGYFFIKP